MIVQGRVSCSEGRRETTVHRGVNEFRALGEEELSNVMQSKASLFHSVCNSHCLEVTAIVNLPGFTINKRIVGSRVAFDLNALESREQILNLRAEELRSCSERISVLSKGPLIVFDGNFLFV